MGCRLACFSAALIRQIDSLPPVSYLLSDHGNLSRSRAGAAFGDVDIRPAGDVPTLVIVQVPEFPGAAGLSFVEGPKKLPCTAVYADNGVRGQIVESDSTCVM